MLSVTFGILSVLCLIYFCVIVVYSGIETSAVGIWLALAVLFFLLSRGSVYYSRHKNKVPLWLPVSAVTLCALGLTVFLILQFFIFSGMMRASSRQPLDYLIVLGAKVREDDISSSLKRRLDKVIRYVEEHPETKLVLSGGQGPGEPTTEAQAMAEYLRYNGVAPEQMLLEMSSTSTKENMICSKALIEDQKRQEKEKAEKEQRKAGERRMELDLFIRKTEKLAAGQSVSGQPFTTQPPSAVQQMPGEKAVPSVHVSAPRQETELLPDKPMQVGVLTSNFHLFRAVQIGKKQGFDHLSGVASSTDPVLFLHLCVRESLAILKDKFMGNM